MAKEVKGVKEGGPIEKIRGFGKALVGEALSRFNWG
jgi:hypothetical protein